MIHFLSALFLVGILCFGAPMALFASTNNGDAELFANSKEITIVENYKYYQYIKQSIKYNDGAWSGTLLLDRTLDTGYGIRAYYTGIVYCTGVCPQNDFSH